MVDACSTDGTRAAPYMDGMPHPSRCRNRNTNMDGAQPYNGNDNGPLE